LFHLTRNAQRRDVWDPKGPEVAHCSHVANSAGKLL
jgi:hypothetical protein